MILARICRDAAYGHLAIARSVRTAAYTAFRDRHARQELDVLVLVVDVEVLKLLGVDRNDAYRDILQALGVLRRGNHDFLQGAARRLLLRECGMDRSGDGRGYRHHPHRAYWNRPGRF